MTEKNLKAFFALLILFFMDLARPFGYSLISEFLFLGIVFISMNYSLRITLILSIIFGYLKDTTSTSSMLFNIFEYSLIAISVHYFLHNFRKNTAFFVIFYGALIIHIIVNSFYINSVSWAFAAVFIVQSSVMFLILNFLLSSWLKIPLVENE